MRTLKFLVTYPFLLLMLLPFKAYSEEGNNVQLIPVLLRLDGVGEIYGGAVGLKDITESKFSVHVGATTGDVKAGILSISDVKIGKNILNYQFVKLNELNLTTQYTRNAQTAIPYQQLLSGSGHHVGIERQLETPNLSSNIDIILSEISFEGYLDNKGNKININMDGLNDVTSTILRYGLHLDARDNKQYGAGYQLKGTLGLTVGRDGQSDQGQWDYQMSKHYLIRDDILLSAYLKGSHSMVLSINTKYDSDEEIRAELNAQCDALSGDDALSCKNLEDSLVSYILASNKYGTASALGGGSGLRSYGEQFFKGANTLLQGIELDYQLPEFSLFNGESKLHVVAFAETAQINDKLNDLFDDSLHSVGLGLRTYTDDLVLRLETAYGEDGSAWALRVGMPY
jgi:hypothetical protein